MRVHPIRRSLALLLALVAYLPALGDDGKRPGKHKYTNRLAKETSPYLLMHAHNPVDWYPWGPEAFAKAKKEGKLVFLSVGYSSCYWCHVMERESFQDEEVAKILNKWFVCIKVDREERPDIDHVYMTALTQVISPNRGGWPMSMFLTPDGRPFFGGTYFPKPVFIKLLNEIRRIQQKEPKRLEEFATKIARETKRILANETPRVLLFEPDRSVVAAALNELDSLFDPIYGGFGNPATQFRGAKFPTPTRLMLLLYQAERHGDKKRLAMVTKTLDRMARGGIYDQVGGGFHRYSTERTWTVPHFEKMLYDNGQLLEVYAWAYRLTKNDLYRRVIRETVTYLEREMLEPPGRFYSSQDAETEEEEGRFYVWTDAELAKALPDAAERKLALAIFGADKGYNFEGKYHILYLPKPLAEVAKEKNEPHGELLRRFEMIKAKLYAARKKRVRPFVNKISLAGWSGLAIAGLARSGQVLEDAKYIRLAERAATFILKKQRGKDGRLYRTYGAAPGKKPGPAVRAFLEDYAAVVHALLNLYEATKDRKWLREAQSLTTVMRKHHEDKKNGGFYFASHDSDDLFARAKDQFDGAVPSGNSLAARNLTRLWILTGDKDYRRSADRTFRAFAFNLKNSPSSLTTMVHGIALFVDHAKAGD